MLAQEQRIILTNPAEGSSSSNGRTLLDRGDGPVRRQISRINREVVEAP